MTLDEHLRSCMRQTKLLPGVSSEATETLRTALADDATLHSEARAMIDAGATVEQRDHITRWRSALLRSALGDPHV
jgi:hypothetical protein